MTTQDITSLPLTAHEDIDLIRTLARETFNRFMTHRDVLERRRIAPAGLFEDWTILNWTWQRHGHEWDS